MKVKNKQRLILIISLLVFSLFFTLVVAQETTRGPTYADNDGACFFTELDWSAPTEVNIYSCDIDSDGDGYTSDVDCNDGDASIHPDADDSNCDSVDDDCDGSIDEDYVSDESCFLPGVCTAGDTGSTCVAGTETACSTGSPSGISEAICNGDDDNCDGAVDEDYVSDESCFLPGACAVENTASSCEYSVEIPCSTGTPTGETCNNIDDNCDGTVDEGCECTTGDTQSCGSDVGECSTGTQTCQSGGTWGTCVDEVGSNPEECDGLDNDCDGSTDEGLTRATTCGVGACEGNTGQETCAAGVWGSDTCNPFTGAAPEVCEGSIDEDCDDSIDCDDPDCTNDPLCILTEAITTAIDDYEKSIDKTISDKLIAISAISAALRDYFTTIAAA